MLTSLTQIHVKSEHTNCITAEWCGLHKQKHFGNGLFSKKKKKKSLCKADKDSSDDGEMHNGVSGQMKGRERLR